MPENPLAKKFKKAIMRKVFQVVHQIERQKKENSKIFEQKKMLKARVTKMISGLIERPKCPDHIKKQRDYQLKIDFINSKWEREHGVGEHANDKINKN